MQTNTQEPELMHVKEAAAALDVHESTIRRAIHSGELRALRLGEHGRYRVRRRDLDAYLKPVEADS